MMEKNAKIYVAGHRGMVGSAIVRELQRQGYTNIITRTHKELGPLPPAGCGGFLRRRKAGVCLLAAAKVGGIVANQEALADFMYYNMTLEMNAIHSAWQNGCKKAGIPGLFLHLPPHGAPAHAGKLPADQRVGKRPTRPTPWPRSAA